MLDFLTAGEIDQFKAHLRNEEGSTNWIYQDIYRKPTIAVGCLITLPFNPEQYGGWYMANGIGVIDLEEVHADLARVLAAPPMHRAEFYKTYCKTRMSAAGIEALFNKRLAQTEKDTLIALPFFPTLMKPAKLAVLDMGFNMGPYKIPSSAKVGGFPVLYTALLNHNYQICADECTREPNNPAFKARNAWTKAKFLECLSS